MKHKVDKEKTTVPASIIIISIIVIIVAIIAGIIFLPNLFGNNDPKYVNGENQAIYNYYEFNKQEDQKWYLELSIDKKPYMIPFYYNPFETEDIFLDNVTMQTIATFKNRTGPKVIYISIDPLATSKMAVAAFEIKRLLDKNYDVLNFDAYYGIHYLHEDNYTEYPVATCKDARPDRLIMILNITGENSITTANNCIHINSKDDNESIRVSDAFAYRILGIVQYSTINRDK
jgi:hypothetical protein